MWKKNRKKACSFVYFFSIAEFLQFVYFFQKMSRRKIDTLFTNWKLCEKHCKRECTFSAFTVVLTRKQLVNYLILYFSHTYFSLAWTVFMQNIQQAWTLMPSAAVHSTNMLCMRKLHHTYRPFTAIHCYLIKSITKILRIIVCYQIW